MTRDCLVESLAESVKRRVLYSRSGDILHTSLSALVETENSVFQQCCSEEVSQGTNTMPEEAV